MKAVEAPSDSRFPGGTREDLGAFRWAGPEKSFSKVQGSEYKLANRTHESEVVAGSLEPPCDWKKYTKLLSTRKVQGSYLVMKITEFGILKLFFLLINYEWQYFLLNEGIDEWKTRWMLSEVSIPNMYIFLYQENIVFLNGELHLVLKKDSIL